MPNDTAPCRHQTLATSRVCRVDRCEHGTLHVALGDMTLRMRPEDLIDLARAVAAAARQIAGEPAEPEARPRYLC